RFVYLLPTWCYFLWNLKIPVSRCPRSRGSFTYGTTRPMHLDRWGPDPAWVRILGWQPLHEPSLRVITGELATSPRKSGHPTTE
ncbi:hypothetical protein, partial [Streptomyces microflavus]|uniref:hypothetical protein n=1 Tax=Streptomyces microflavus TaxID=1919 RepID=UPI0033E270C5